jgi:hypothetical protein
MKIRKMIIIGIMFLFSINTCVALDVLNIDPFSIHNANAFTGEKISDTFVFLSGGSPNNIMISDYLGNYYTIGYGNNTFNNPISVYCSSNGYIYFSSTHGVFKITQTKYTAPKDLGLYSNIQFISSDTTVRSWAEDSNYIYFFVQSTKTLKRINKANGLVSTHNVYTHGNLNYVMDIEKVGNDVYFIGSTSEAPVEIFLIKNNGEKIRSILYKSSTNPTSTQFGSYIEYIGNDTFFLSSMFFVNGHYMSYNHQTNAFNNDLLLTVINNYGVFNPYASENVPLLLGSIGSIGKNNKILCYRNGRNLAFIEIYDIGLNNVDNGLTPSQITYNTQNVYSEYTSYYNQSSVKVNWKIAIDETWIDNELLSYNVFDRYDFTIELFSPDGISVNSYTINDNSFKRESYWLGIIGKGDMISIGSINYPNVNINGTWTIRMYEYNRLQGTKALIGSSTFEVLNTNNPASTIGTTPINNDPQQSVFDFIVSKYFIGLIAFVVVVKAIGTDRIGRLNGNMAVMGVVVATIVLVLAGIFPIWTIFVIVLYGLIMIAKENAK